MTAREVSHWTPVCPAAEIAPGTGRTLDVVPPVAVWNVQGIFFATDDTCTHEKYSLADGYMDGFEVECALHWAKFDVRSGSALTLPATRDLLCYPVTVDAAGIVLVDLSRRGAQT